MRSGPLVPHHAVLVVAVWRRFTRISRRLRLAAQLAQLLRVAVEQPQQVADGLADQNLTAFVLLKCVRPTADEVAGLSLRQPQPLADRPDLVRPERLRTRAFKVARALSETFRSSPP